MRAFSGLTHALVGPQVSLLRPLSWSVSLPPCMLRCLCRLFWEGIPAASGDHKEGVLGKDAGTRINAAHRTAERPLPSSIGYLNEEFMANPMPGIRNNCTGGLPFARCCLGDSSCPALWEPLQRINVSLLTGVFYIEPSSLMALGYGFLTLRS